MHMLYTCYAHAILLYSCVTCRFDAPSIVNLSATTSDKHGSVKTPFFKVFVWIRLVTYFERYMPATGT